MINKIFLLLNYIDVLMATVLPLPFRICLYGLFAGASAMFIYKLISDQSKLSELKKEIKQLQQQLLKKELEYSEFSSLSKKNLKLSLTLLAKSLGPALISAIPVIIIALWLQTFYSFTTPENDQLIALTSVPCAKELTVEPKNIVQFNEKKELFIKPSKTTKKIIVKHKGKKIFSGNIFTPPTAEVSKRKWWNLLLGNAAGYIDDKSAINSIKFDFPKTHLFKGLPEWLSGWEFAFFMSVLIASVLVKVIFKLQ